VSWGRVLDRLAAQLADVNNSRFAAYQTPIAGADGRVALLGSAWFTLPASYSDALSCVADLRIRFDAIRPAPEPPPAGSAQVPADRRVTRVELASFLTQAWQLTTMTLPLTVTASPAGLSPAGAPRLELYIQNERPGMSGKDRPLRTLDMIDLSSFGQPRRDPPGDLSVGVTAPVGLPETRVTALVSDALARMSKDFGFIGPDAPIP
jgi:hypothetical protein